VEAAVNPFGPLKKFTAMVFRKQPGQSWATSFWPFGTNSKVFDYAGAVGDGTGSSTVMAPLLWIARNFPEAPPALWTRIEDGQEEQQHDHPMLRLLQRPNAFYSGVVFWMATIVDWSVDGNAYWLKLRNRAGEVVELWWVPSWMMTPVGDADTFVDYYEYRPEGIDPVRVDPADVVHFRFGLDPGNDRKGYSPLKSVLREVFTDDEAARFTATLLRNMGVPGLVVSPAGTESPSQADVLATKSYLKAAFSGEGRGEPLVMSGPTKIEQFGFSPEQLLLRELRRIPEERVSAVLGVPAIVAGLGAGLERSTFTNMGEAREMAYESNIIPTQRILSEDIRFQLLTEFEDDPWAWRCGFDLTKVRVLQDDEDKILRRYDVAIRGGWAKVSEGRRKIGLPVEQEDDVYLRPFNVGEVTAGTTGRPHTSGPVPGSNGNGNGSAHAAEEAVRAIVGGSGGVEG
jgi:HK97 family phage portal protein